MQSTSTIAPDAAGLFQRARQPRPGPPENGETGRRNCGLHVGARVAAEECELALWTGDREREEGRRKGGARGYRGGEGHRCGYRRRLQALWRALSNGTIMRRGALSLRRRWIRLDQGCFRKRRRIDGNGRRP